MSKSLKSYCKGKDRSSESLLCAPVFRNSDPWEKVGHKHFLLLPAIDRVELGRTGEGRTGAKLCQVIQESQTCAALQGLLVEHTKQEQPCFSTYSGSHFLLPRGLGKLSFSRRGSLLKGSREVEVRKGEERGHGSHHAHRKEWAGQAQGRRNMEKKVCGKLSEEDFFLLFLPLLQPSAACQSLMPQHRPRAPIPL